ncbi:hypothetical protein HHL16_14215 [Pseudoflavitalea sp. G-6-1-2]|uniref:hypothetical protein n=1 Tax=Pseudoflavitalea sp. G-6-1-2 TaxID=2728841 RepID=UPI00146A668F|nr:hypothetical protein [Pseudoflavitalea sp. G-6-1-2]NML22037.1 hypothetical protein [Pseudoflavitalea sp. G-6-1-2]
MTRIKIFREIKIADQPEKEILPEVRELARALNQQEMGVPAFCKSEKISQSKVYSWFAGKTQPKRHSILSIHAFFEKIGFEMNSSPAVQENDTHYYVGKLLHSDNHLDSQSMSTIIKDMQLALRIQSEQNEFIKQHTSRLTEQLNYITADVKAIHEYLAMHHAKEDGSSKDVLLQLFRKLSANYYSG